MVSIPNSAKMDLMTVLGIVTVLIGAWDLADYFLMSYRGIIVLEDAKYLFEFGGCAFMLIAGLIVLATRGMNNANRLTLACMLIGIAVSLRSVTVLRVFIYGPLAIATVLGVIAAVLMLVFSVRIVLRGFRDISSLYLFSAILAVVDAISLASGIYQGHDWPFTMTMHGGMLPFVPIFVLLVAAMRSEGVPIVPKNDSGDPDLMLLLGVLMIVAGACNAIDLIITYYPDFYLIEDMSMVLQLSSDAVLIAGGVFVLSSERYRYWTRASIAGLFFGVQFMLMNLRAGYLESDNLEFAVSIVAIVVGAASLVASISMVFGYKHYATRLFQAMLVMVLVSILPFYECYHYEIPMDTAFMLNYPQFAFIASYAIMLVVLHHESVRVVTVNERVDSSLGVINGMMYSDTGAFIIPEDMERIERFIASPSEDSIHVPIQDGGSDSEIVMKQSSDGRILGFVVPVTGRSFSDGFRFEACSLVHADESLVRIYGKDGAFVQLLVHPIPPRRTLRDRLLIFPAGSNGQGGR